MMILATNSNLQDVGNKIITIGMLILISLEVVIGIIMVAYYAIGGKFTKNADQRKETIAQIIWVGVCLGIVILASSLVLGFKNEIINWLLFNKKIILLYLILFWYFIMYF